MNQFLYTIGFFEAARELEILTWDERIIGGLPRTSFNPNNKILSFYNVPEKVDYKNQVQLNIIKEELRQECYETILAKFKLLFSYSDINYVFDPDLVYFLCTNCAELIVNGLIHLKSTKDQNHRKASECSIIPRHMPVSSS